MRIRYTTESFIEKANTIHSNKFSYDKTIYVKWTEKVIITCPIHGDFEQTPGDHLSGRGCYKCGRSQSAKKQSSGLDIFVEKAKSVHGDKYDYSKVSYTTARKPVTIICKKHGEFVQTPDAHLRSKHGCLQCGLIATADSCRSNTEVFIQKVSKKFKDKFDYSKVEYTTAISDIKVKCNRCSMTFVTKAYQHLANGACPTCDSKRFDFTKPAILYYLRVNGGQAYKIGITNYSVEKRYSKEELTRLHILKTWEYAIGKDAHAAEQYYLNEYKHAKYNGDPLLVSGNTELFAYDVLLLDT